MITETSLTRPRLYSRRLKGPLQVDRYSRPIPAPAQIENRRGGRRFEPVRREHLLDAAAAALRLLPVSSTVIGPPRRSVSTLDEWLRSSPDAEVVRVSDAVALELPVPAMIQPLRFYEAYASGRRDPLRTTVRADAGGQIFYEQTARFVVSIRDGRVLGPEGTIISAEDELLSFLSAASETELPVARAHPRSGALRLPRVRHVRGSMAVLATFAGHNYSHWMMEVMPRIPLLQAAGHELERFDAFYVTGSDAPFQSESLRRAGVPAEKVIDAREHPHVRADRLVVPSPTSEVDEASDFACDYLNQLWDPGIPTGTDARIYVSRNRSDHRRVANEREVMDALAPLGFVKITAETMSMQQKAEVFAGAEVVVAPHGSTFANFAFCRPGTTVVEIQSPRMLQICGITVGGIRQLRYGLLLSEGVDRSAHPLKEDMRIDPAKLLELLGQLDVVAPG
jgi:capsular polysaccharide biosynthesis protein